MDNAMVPYDSTLTLRLAWPPAVLAFNTMDISESLPVPQLNALGGFLNIAIIASVGSDFVVDFPGIDHDILSRLLC